VVLLGHEGVDDHRGELGVIVAGERVADVVDERADDVLLVAPVAMCARGGLERMGEPVDRVSAGVTGEERQVTEDAVGQALLEAERVARDDGVIVPRGVHHAGEGGLRPVVGSHVPSHTPSPRPSQPRGLSPGGRDLLEMLYLHHHREHVPDVEARQTEWPHDLRLRRHDAPACSRSTTSRS